MKLLNGSIPKAKNIDEGLQSGLEIIQEQINFQYAIVWYNAIRIMP